MMSAPSIVPASFSVMPSSASAPPPKSLAVLVEGDRELGSIIRLVLARSGVPDSEVARRLGIKPQTLNQYKTGRRCRPSIQWLLKLVEACGGKILVEFGAADLR